MLRGVDKSAPPAEMCHARRNERGENIRRRRASYAKFRAVKLAIFL